MKLKQIKKVCDKVYGFDISEKTRLSKYVYARKVFCKVARDNGYGLEEIGDAINRSHCNALHLIRTFNTVYDYDRDMFAKINKIIERTDDINKSNIEKYADDLDLYRIRIAELETELSIIKKDDTNDISTLIGNEIGRWSNYHIRNFVETRLKPYKLINKL